MSQRLHSAKTGGGRRRPPPFFTHRKPKGVHYPHVNVAGACARALKSDCRPFPPMTARDRIRDMRNPLKIESAFWVTFWVSWVFVSLRFFRSAPDSGGQRKKKNPRYFVSGDSGLVGAEGFGPSTFCSRSKRATRLRYAPTGMKTENSIPHLVRRGKGACSAGVIFRCGRADRGMRKECPSGGSRTGKGASQAPPRRAQRPCPPNEWR